MSRLLHAYRAFHEQVFVPIFVQDRFPTDVLIEGCLLAGVKGIEYTLRRPDVDKAIPRIRESYPDLFLWVGSTIDDERIVKHAAKRHSQIRTISELDAMGVDGFVSMLGWTEESIRRYCSTKIVIPTAYTLNDAFHHTAAGAHFAKIIGPDLGLAKTCRAAPTFGFCPMFMTGGMTLEIIPQAIAAGVMLVGSGFDLMLKDLPDDVTPEEVAEVLKRFVDTAQAARARQYPELAEASGADMQSWLDLLPHYHPFDG